MVTNAGAPRVGYARALAGAAEPLRTEVVPPAGTPMTAACVALDDGPRDLAQFQAAHAAAAGDPIEEIDADTTRRGMVIWCPETSTWFVVKDSVTYHPNSLLSVSKCTTSIEILAPAPVLSRSWDVEADRPLVRRFPSRRPT